MLKFTPQNPHGTVYHIACVTFVLETLSVSRSESVYFSTFTLRIRYKTTLYIQQKRILAFPWPVSFHYYIAILFSPLDMIRCRSILPADSGIPLRPFFMTIPTIQNVLETYFSLTLPYLFCKILSTSTLNFHFIHRVCELPSGC